MSAYEPKHHSVGVKNCFFRDSCFGFIVKGVCPLLLPLVSLLLRLSESFVNNPTKLNALLFFTDVVGMVANVNLNFLKLKFTTRSSETKSQAPLLNCLLAQQMRPRSLRI